MDNMFAEISKMSTTLQGVAADIITIKETTNELKNTVNGIQERLEEAEGRICHLEDTTERLEWEGLRLSMFPDMSRELAEKKKTFMSVKKTLQQLNVRYMLAYPATLRFTWKEKNWSFTSAKEAVTWTMTIRLL